MVDFLRSTTRTLFISVEKSFWKIEGGGAVVCDGGFEGVGSMRGCLLVGEDLRKGGIKEGEIKKRDV